MISRENQSKRDKSLCTTVSLNFPILYHNYICNSWCITSWRISIATTWMYYTQRVKIILFWSVSRNSTSVFIYVHRGERVIFVFSTHRDDDNNNIFLNRFPKFGFSEISYPNIECICQIFVFFFFFL